MSGWDNALAKRLLEGEEERRGALKEGGALKPQLTCPQELLSGLSVILLFSVLPPLEILLFSLTLMAQCIPWHSSLLLQAAF